MGEHDHCDHDPLECSYDALVGEYREAVAERDQLRAQHDGLRVLIEEMEAERRPVRHDPELDHHSDEARAECEVCSLRAERDRLRNAYERARGSLEAIHGYVTEPVGITNLEGVAYLAGLALEMLDALDVSGDMGGSTSGLSPPEPSAPVEPAVIPFEQESAPAGDTGHVLPVAEQTGQPASAPVYGHEAREPRTPEEWVEWGRGDGFDVGHRDEEET